MEAIRTYLESMFAHLPRTPEVLRAKTELGQMMEDKYAELIGEGKSENEAVGIVISEFGNLDELAEELGIKSFMEEEPVGEAERVISFEEVRDYLKERTRLSYMTAFGIFFLVVSAVPIILFTGIPFPGGVLPKFFGVVGLVLLFLLLAGGLGMTIYSGIQERQYAYIWSNGSRLDYSAREYVRAEFAEYRSMHTILVVVGIVMCILCALPAGILGFLDTTSPFWAQIGGAITLFIGGVAVFLFVLAGRRRGGMNKLLLTRQSNEKGNGEEQAGKTHKASEDGLYYENEYLAKLMSVYWPSILCLYLIVSFLTFQWGATWIIWPVAAIVHAVLSKTFGKHTYEM